MISVALHLFQTLEYLKIDTKDLKFMHPEKATKFCKTSTLLLSVCTVDKSKMDISQNFVASQNIQTLTKVTRILEGEDRYLLPTTNRSIYYISQRSFVVNSWWYILLRRGWSFQLLSHRKPFSCNRICMRFGQILGRLAILKKIWADI